MRAARRAETTVLVALLMASCNSVSVPRVPQVEQAQETLQSGGERYRAHRACANAVKSADGLIACMRDAGWDFVARDPGYPDADCWDARDRGDVDRVIPICFLRKSGRPTGAAP